MRGKIAGPLSRGQIPPVLIVDADQDTAEMYAIGMHLAGLDAICTSTADDAVSLLHARRYAAVVVDAESVSSGPWRLSHELSAAGRAGTPVVMLTADTLEETAPMAGHLGCVRVLAKPCLPNELSDIVRHLQWARAVPPARRSGHDS